MAYGSAAFALAVLLLRSLSISLDFKYGENERVLEEARIRAVIVEENIETVVEAMVLGLFVLLVIWIWQRAWDRIDARNRRS